MPLLIYRSNRAEALVDELVTQLANDETRPADPFAELPIVVGSRGMARWLKHQVATRRGVAARLAFPFPQPALHGAAAALLGQVRGPQPFWQRSGASDPWASGALTWRLVELIRSRIAGPAQPDDAFSRVRRYLQADVAGAVVGARELGFAADVAGVVDELLSARPQVAARWIEAGQSTNDGPERTHTGADDRWLAALLRDLTTSLPDESGAAKWRTLAEAMDSGAALADVRGHVHIFGLSTLPRHDLQQLATVSRAPHLTFHLYLLAPSMMWLGDHPSRRDVAQRLEAAARQQESGGDADGVALYNAQRAIIDEREAANPLLADLGRPSRDVQALLESLAPHYREPALEAGPRDLFVTPDGDTVLDRLQRDLLFARPPQDPSNDAERGIKTTDRSVTLHPCHGALRQVEILRQELLASFAADPTLEPRHVLVMTPDIATYAPLVAAVFGQVSKGAEREQPGDGKRVDVLPAIPVEIADLGLRATNAVADVLLSVLELATERVTLSALFALLELTPVRTRFGLTTDDTSDLLRMLIESGARWGIDADDRAAAPTSQPHLHQNTLAFGMERIALGALFLDEGGSDGGDSIRQVLTSTFVSDGDEASSDFVPFDALNEAGIGRFGRMHAFVSALLHHRGEVQRPATAKAWRQRFDDVIGDLTETSDASAWLVGRVATELDALATDAESAEFSGLIGLDAMRAMLAGRFELARMGDRLITGAVTVCALEPMRSVPFKVVALLGVDDGAFPRLGARPAWHPMSHGRQAGEHDRRDIDRHLLLESLLSARDRVMVFWSGFDAHTGDALPPAVPIRELMDAVDRRFEGWSDASGRRTPASELLTLPGALQPWSEPCFVPLDRRIRRPFSYDAPMRAGALELRALNQGEAVSVPPTIQAGDLSTLTVRAADDDGRTIDIDVLAGDLINPSKALLKRRFNLRLKGGETEVPDREPFALDSLQSWQLRDNMLRRLLSSDGDADAATLTRRLRAQGWLPIGPAGDANVLDQELAANAITAVVAEQLQVATTALHSALRGRAIDVSVADPAGAVWALGGEPVIVADDPLNSGCDQLVLCHAGGLKGKSLLKGWICVLAAAAGQQTRPVSGALMAHHGGANQPVKVAWLQAPDPEAAKAALGQLLQMWRTAQQVPVPLFATTSYALIVDMQQHAQGLPWASLPAELRAELRAGARDQWHGRDGYGGDGDDAWVAAVYGEPDFHQALPEPTDDGGADAAEPPWIATARLVWAPILAALCNPDARAARASGGLLSADGAPR